MTRLTPFLIARVEPVEESTEKSLPVEALMRAVLALFEKCVKASKNLPEDHYIAAMNVEEPGRLADLVASSLDLSVAQRQDLLETLDPSERLQKISIHPQPRAGVAGTAKPDPLPGAAGGR